MMPQRISKKILIYLLIFFSLVTINNTKLSNDFFKIKQLNIIGLDTLETAKIYDDLIIFKNDNIFLFNKENFSKKIYSNKFVDRFKIFKIYPSTLNIEIKRTKFLAITKNNNSDYFIGNNGKLIKKDNTNFNLPYIFGNVNVQNFLEFKLIIDKSNFKFNEIENLYHFQSNRWDMETQSGLLIKLPSNLTIQKLNLIYEIINNDEFNKNKILDFRQNNMIVINE